MEQAVVSLIEHYRKALGTVIHTGPWLEMTQERIDRFAAVTGDMQWIHTDPERAARESPFGSTVAHGYLTLALLPYLTESNHPELFRRNYPGMRYRVNYGLNRVRFPHPVRPGDRIRALTVPESIAPVGEGAELLYRLTVEIEGREKPACVAEFVARLYP